MFAGFMAALLAVFMSAANAGTTIDNEEDPVRAPAAEGSMTFQSVYYHFSGDNTIETKQEKMPLIKCVVENNKINCDKNSVEVMINMPLMNFWIINKAK